MTPREQLAELAEDAGWPALTFATSPRSGWVVQPNEGSWHTFLGRAWDSVVDAALSRLTAGRPHLLGPAVAPRRRSTGRSRPRPEPPPERSPETPMDRLWWND